MKSCKSLSRPSLRCLDSTLDFLHNIALKESVERSRDPFIQWLVLPIIHAPTAEFGSILKMENRGLKDSLTCHSLCPTAHADAADAARIDLRIRSSASPQTRSTRGKRQARDFARSEERRVGKECRSRW